MTTAIVVPWRAGSPERERNAEFVLRWYEPLGLPIFLGDAGGESFNRGASRNAAIEAAVGHDLFLVLDADCVCDLDVVRRGLDVARETGTLVICHDNFWRLSERGTQQLVSNLDHYRAHPGDVVGLTGQARLKDGQMPSGGLAITRDAFARIGGYASIPSWGYEDSVFLIEARETVGVTRLEGYMWHLAHPRQTGTIETREQGRILAESHLAERRAARVV